MPLHRRHFFGIVLLSATVQQVLVVKAAAYMHRSGQGGGSARYVAMPLYHTKGSALRQGGSWKLQKAWSCRSGTKPGAYDKKIKRPRTWCHVLKNKPVGRELWTNLRNAFFCLKRFFSWFHDIYSIPPLSGSRKLIPAASGWWGAEFCFTCTSVKAIACVDIIVETCTINTVVGI